MLGLSVTEILVICALILILFGPDELPKMAKTIGKGLRDLRKAGDDLRTTVEQEMVKLDVEETIKPEDRPKPEALPPPVPDDPAAARAAARFAAVGAEPPPAAGSAPAEPPKPAGEPVVKLVPPEGSIPREAAGPGPGGEVPPEGPHATPDEARVSGNAGGGERT